MGYNCEAWAVIGVPLRKQQLLLKKEVLGCSCNPDSENKFCPVCGKPAKKTVEEPVFKGKHGGLPEYDEELAPDVVLRRPDSEAADYYLGVHFVAQARYFAGIPDFTGIKEKIKGLLEPCGLWDEEDFGLWVVKYESCR